MQVSLAKFTTRHNLTIAATTAVAVTAIDIIVGAACAVIAVLASPVLSMNWPRWMGHPPVPVSARETQQNGQGVGRGIPTKVMLACSWFAPGLTWVKSGSEHCWCSSLFGTAVGARWWK